MPRWTKAQTFAEALTKSLSGDKASFDSTVAIFQKAIDYGRQQERKAALDRLQKTFEAGGFGGGYLTSGESWIVANRAVEGEIVRNGE